MQNYKILDQVGEGTYGRVFKAVDLRTNEVVAIKQLFPLGHEEGVSYLALQEIKSLKFLNDCKHIVKLLNVFSDKDKSDKDCLCLVFQYASADLTGLLSLPNYTPSLSHVKCLFKQLLEGLFEIHKRFLMHRDIKAANLLIHNGQLQLGDLGMMTNFKQRNDFAANVVTLWYRAPELLLEAPKYGPEVDMWSAGCVFVELMTKKSPFPGYNEHHQMDLIFKVLGTPDPSTWPGVDQLPGYKKLRKGLYKSSQLRKIFKDWDAEAIDLLEQLFAPPHKRITAEEALNHPFFKVEPLPSDPSELARLPSMHEYEVKGKKRPQAPSQYSSSSSSSTTYNTTDISQTEQTKKRNLYAQQQPPPQQYSSSSSCIYPPQSHEPNNKQMRYTNAPQKYANQQPYLPPHHYQKHQHYDSHSHNHNNNRHHTQQQRPPGAVHVFVPPTMRDTDNLHLYRNGGVADININNGGNGSNNNTIDSMDNNNNRIYTDYDKSSDEQNNSSNGRNNNNDRNEVIELPRRKVVVQHHHTTNNNTLGVVKSLPLHHPLQQNQAQPESPARLHSASTSPQNLSPLQTTTITTQQTQPPTQTASLPQVAAAN